MDQIPHQLPVKKPPASPPELFEVPKQLMSLEQFRATINAVHALYGMPEYKITHTYISATKTVPYDHVAWLWKNTYQRNPEIYRYVRNYFNFLKTGDSNLDAFEIHPELIDESVEPPIVEELAGAKQAQEGGHLQGSAGTAPGVGLAYARYLIGGF